MTAQNEKNLVYRVLDANFNRAVEGLRSVEEYFRFILENGAMTAEIKDLRHAIASVCRPWIDVWTDQRDSTADVGSTIAASDEYHRSGLNDVVGANLARVNQALRALEEYSKVVCPELAPPLEATRYRFYDLEKRVKRFLLADHALLDRQIYVLTSGCDSQADFEARIDQLCRAGADLIQLREKDLDDGELLQRAKAAARICRDQGTLFIVNDRPDVAMMAAADGVHVGQEEFPVSDLRRILPHQMLVGVSTHSLEQALQAERDGADYIGVGPTFPSGTKCFDAFTGPELLEAVAPRITIPAFAIGGIQLDNLEQVVQAGFTRIAVSGAVHHSEQPAETIRQLRSILAGQPTR